MARFVRFSATGLGVSSEPVDVMINPETVSSVRATEPSHTQIDTSLRTYYVRETVPEVLARLA